MNRESFYEQDGVTVFLGDCLDVMRGMPDNSIDSIVTDPPYSLGDQKTTGSKNNILDIFFDVVFPDFYNLYSQLGADFDFIGPFRSVAFLDFMNRSIWVNSGVTMPERPIDFDANIVRGNEEVQDCGVSPISPPDGVLANKANTEGFEFPFHYFLNVRPSIYSPFSDSKTCGLRQLGSGCFSMPVIIPLGSDFARLLRSYTPSDSTFFGDVVRFLNSPESQAETSAFVVTGARTEIIVVLSFDMRRGSVEFVSADRADQFDFLFEFSRPKDIRTFTAASRLSSVFEPFSFSFVDNITSGTFSLYFHKDIIAEINRNRKGFMNKEWDNEIAFSPEVWREALRVAKPGATLMAFGGSRTHHRLACAIEDAGWEIRDCINYLNDGNQAEMAFMASLDEEQLAAYLELHYPNHQMAWVYGSGIGLGYDVSKGIDKRAGKEREVVGRKIRPDGKSVIEAMPNGYSGIRGGWHRPWMDDPEKVLLHKSITAPATPLAAKFNGYKTRLKGSFEPIIVAMKPMAGGFAENAERWGIAGLNIDGCRVPTNGDYHNAGWGPRYGQSSMPAMGGHQTRPYVQEAIRNGEPVKDSKPHPQGRYPANITHSGEPGVLAEFAKAGVRKSGKVLPHHKSHGLSTPGSNDGWKRKSHTQVGGFETYGDTGSAARYFAQCPPDEWPRFVYQAKAGRKERATPGNNHPTQKPLELMKYLVRLCRPPDGGIVLDPFAGSGTTALACRAENRRCILIEKEEPYCHIVVNRLNGQTNVTPPQTEARETGPQVKQLSIMDDVNGMERTS